MVNQDSWELNVLYIIQRYITTVVKKADYICIFYKNKYVPVSNISK